MDSLPISASGQRSDEWNEDGREQRLREIRREAERIASGQATPPPALLPHQASVETGYYGLPLLKKPQWRPEVPLYLFAGGAAGSAAVIASVAGAASRDPRLASDARCLAAIGALVSPVLLIADLGRPERFLNMLRIFKPQSPMSVGSWTLVVFSNAAVTSAVLNSVEWKIPFRRVMARAAQTVSVITGPILATYTGVLVGATAVPVWHDNVSVMPIHFAASGVSTAASLLELRGHNSPALNRLALGAAAVETAVGASFELNRRPASEPLRSGANGLLMRTAGVLSGPVPLALRLLALASNQRRSRQLRKVAAISSVVGSLLTRWAWIRAGTQSARDPRVPLQLPELKMEDAPRPLEFPQEQQERPRFSMEK